MRKTRCVLIAIFSIALPVFAQKTVIANKDLIHSFSIGNDKDQISYSSNEEGFFGPGAPEIDNTGKIWFFPVTNKFILTYFKDSVETVEYPETYPRQFMIGPNSWPSINQQGRFGFTDYPSDLVAQLKKTVKLTKIDPHGNRIFPLPNGIAIQFSDYSNRGEVVSIEYKNNQFSMIMSLPREFVARTNEETRDWLPSQPGGFTIGDDGLLYRKGILWSVVNQPKYGTLQYEYEGRLASGHCIWKGGGAFGSPGEFVITDPVGNVEVVLELPWSKAIEDEQYQYNYGLGPWGEIYFLLPPKFIAGKKQGRNPEGGYYPVYEPDQNGTAELVVVRNHLKYFGRLNDSGVRLRKDPSTSGEILGTYPEKTGFRILETGSKQETIGGQKNVWYKVRLLDGTEGWFFGTFVHNLYDGPNGNPPPWPNIPDW